MSTINDKVILINNNNIKIGEKEKIEAHKKGLLHRAFSVVLFNHQGEMLLQKRQKDKYHSGGLWTNTACGHPRPGEKIAEAAKRRLFEEMGIKTKLKKIFTFSYNFNFKNGIIENEIDTVFAGTIKTTKINPDKKEVEDWKWSEKSILQKEIQKEPEKFTYWFKIIYLKLKQTKYES